MIVWTDGVCVSPNAPASEPTAILTEMHACMLGKQVWTLCKIDFFCIQIGTRPKVSAHKEDVHDVFFFASSSSGMCFNRFVHDVSLNKPSCHIVYVQHKVI